MLLEAHIGCLWLHSEFTLHWAYAYTKLLMLMQVGTLNYMSPEAILGGTNNIRGAPPMKVLTVMFALKHSLT